MLDRIELVVFLIISSFSDIYSQPTAEDGARKSRQVNSEACCPCPDVTNSMPRYNEALKTENGNGFPNEGNVRYTPRFRNLDDCPYPSRSVDNEGSSSIFFPTSLRANGPSTGPLNNKEDMKNLLEPEVGLASSVLETIREATEVEYQDALARDAAKSRTVDDAIPNESAPSIVTIILPNHSRENNDDLLLEPTHVHEPRCIHPVGSSHSKFKIQKIIPQNLLEVIPRVANTKSGGFLHKNRLDVDNNVQASNVQERVLQNNHAGLQLKAKSELLGSREENDCLTDFKSHLKTGQSFLLDEKINRSNEETSEVSGDSLQSRPTISTSSSLLPKNNLFKVKNLLKLRDEKLSSPIKNFNNTLLKQPSIFHRRLQDLTDILRNKNYLKHTNEWNSIRKCDNMSEYNGLHMKTSILDKFPTSNVIKMKEKSAIPENHDLHRLSNMQFNPISKTEIIDSVSSPSENIITPNLDDTEEKNHADLPKDTLKENVDVCTNIDEGYEKIDSRSDEITQTPSDLLSDATDNDHNISVTEDRDESINPFSIENAASDDLTTLNGFEYTDEDQEKADSSLQVFENGDNCDSDITSVVIDEPFSPGGVETTTLFDDDSLKSVTKLVNKNISLPLTKSLKLIKEDIQKKIQEIRRTPKLFTQNILTTITESNKQNKEKSAIQDNSSNTDCQNADSIAQLELLKPNNPNETENNLLDTVSMEDLQKMSDSLLYRNELKQKLLNLEKPETNQIGSANLKSVENLSSEPNSEESLDPCLSSTTVQMLQDSRVDKNSNATIKNKNFMIDQTNTDMNSEQSENDYSIEALSSRNTNKSNDQQDLNKPVNLDEMVAEASDPVISALHQGPLSLFSKLKSPLLQDIIVQPSSLIRDDLNPLTDGSELDLSSLLNIPTLDEIRERLGDLLGTSERNSEHEGIDCESNSPIMSSEPSKPISHSIPLLKPLEDIDIDIFQLKPLKIGESNLLSETPRLNLKTYKAKLPIPKNLNLKPMTLESASGNSGGLLGAIFRIGPESGIKNALGSPLQKSSKIEEVTSQLRNNVESLLNNSPLNALQDFRSSPTINTITEDLRSQALNTIKGIQENIGNPLNVVQNGDSLSGLVKQTDALLERITDVTDLNDKLKGLHYDLNDRLLSLHENLLDKTKLRSVSKPLFDDRKTKGNILSTLQQRKNFKTNLADLTTNRGKKINNSFKLRNKPDSEKSSQLRLPKVKGNDKMRLKSYKMPSSASVPVPKSVSVPHLKQTSTKPPSYLGRNLNFKRIPHAMIREQTENQPVISLPSQFKKIKEEQNANTLMDKKTKVTIASTTLSPLSELKLRKPINPLLKTNKNGQTQPEFRLGKNQAKGKPDYITVGSSTETKSVSSQLSNPRKVDSTNNKDIITKTDIKKTMAPTTIKPVKDWLSQREASKTLKSNIFEKKERTTESLPSLDVLTRTVSQSLKKEINPWPEITEKSFLSKMRDAIKARISNVDLERTIKNNENSDVIPDADRAASETTDVVLSEALKENVAYKCRMVCTKET